VALLMLLFCLLLPVMVMLYFDILKVQKQAERTEARIEKVLKNLEEKDKK
jgi:preprotein translocase subunit YajC